MMDIHHWSMSISNIKRIPKLWNISFPIGFQFSNCYWWISNMSISSNFPTGFHKETPKFPTSADKAAIARWTAKAGIRSFSNTKVPLAEFWLMKYSLMTTTIWVISPIFWRSPYFFWWNHVKSCEILCFWGRNHNWSHWLHPLFRNADPAVCFHFWFFDFSVRSPRARPAGKGTNWNLRWRLKMSHFYQFVDESPKRSSHFHCQLTQENWLGDSRLRF